MLAINCLNDACWKVGHSFEFLNKSRQGQAFGKAAHCKADAQIGPGDFAVSLFGLQIPGKAQAWQTCICHGSMKRLITTAGLCKRQFQIRKFLF